MPNFFNINLYDNSTISLSELNIDSNNVISVYNDIVNIANKPIINFEQSNLIMFPKETKDEIEKLPICELSLNKTDAEPREFLESTISTGNLMGFIRTNNTQVNIKSRFCEKDEEDFFLQYMLSRIFHLNIMNLKHSISKNDLFEIYIFLLVGLLKKAMRKGIYKLYKTFYHNDSTIKGTIDVSRFIKADIPFLGNIATVSRQYSFDNHINQLIRHTIEYISSKPNYSYLFTTDKEIKQIVRIIREITPTYDRRQRFSVMKANKKKVSHPFLSEYTELQKLCLLILGKEKISYSDDSQDLYGILFDGSWLWEEYLATIIEEHNLGFIHSNSKKSEYGIDIFHGNTCYPDFYKYNSRLTKDIMNNCVLDAKYQNLNSFKREGLHQLITYMHILPAYSGALIHPYKSENENKECTIQRPGYRTYSPNGNLFGLGGNACIIHVPIPKTDNISNMQDYAAKMKDLETDLADTISCFMNGTKLENVSEMGE